MSTENTRYLSRRRHRREKVRRMRMRLQKAADSRERTKLLDKLWKINPVVAVEERARP